LGLVVGGVGSWRPSWVGAGEEAIRAAGVERYRVEPRFVAATDDSVDHFRWWLSRGAIAIDHEEVAAGELPELHDAFDCVYYPDGSARWGVGVAAYARFAGLRAERADVHVIQEREADGFVAEQRAILRCLEDAVGNLGAGAAAAPGKRILVLTDSLSNIASVSSAGPRDAGEQDIIRSLVRLASLGASVTLRFVRAHAGALGNEMSDSASKGAREKTSLRVKDTPGREIAMNLCRSRLFESAAGEQGADLRDKAMKSASGNHLFHSDKALAGNPLLNKGVDGALTTRRDEIVYNQMRLGCTTFTSGPRWRWPGAPVCALCSKPDGPGHALFSCDKLAMGRRQLFTRVMRERAEEIARKTDEDRRNGRPSRFYRTKRTFDAMILNQHPDAVLEFIHNSPVWLDQFAQSCGLCCD
jgi:ribonuclease HI